MMNFLTQPQVPLDPRLNAAPMAAAPQPFVVGDYAKKKRIADALRAKASAEVPDQLAPTSQSDGVNGAPGEVYINWGNILSNAAQPWIKGRQEERASAAEDEASAARMEALGRLTGKETPQELVSLGEQTGMKELTNAGITQMTTPPKDYTAQKIQYGGTAAGMRSLNAVLPGSYTDEQIAAQANAEETERQRVQREKIAVKQAGVAPRAADSKAQVLGGMYAKFSAMPDGPEKKAYGEQIRQMELMDDAPKTGGGGVTFNPETGELEATRGGSEVATSTRNKYLGTAMTLDEDARERGANLVTAKSLKESLLNADGSARSRTAEILMNNDMPSLAAFVNDGAGQQLTADRIRLALQDARKLAPVSDNDFNKILAMIPSALGNAEASAALIDRMIAISERGLEGVKVESAMNRAQAEGLVRGALTPKLFENQVNGAKAKMDPDTQKHWDKLPFERRYELWLETKYGE